MTTTNGYHEVKSRSGGQCEAMVLIPRRNIYTRCWKSPVEIHHLLTRARGGAVLDKVGETYHLIALCPDCHRRSDGAEAYMGGLLIDGYAALVNGKVQYTGTDEYLTKKYPRRSK